MDFYVKDKDGKERLITQYHEKDSIELEKTCFVLFILENNLLNIFSVYLNEKDLIENEKILNGQGCRTLIKEVNIKM